MFQHQYHTKIDDFLERVQVQMVKCIIEKLLSVLESVLAKLARYDEGTFFSSILSLTVSIVYLCMNDKDNLSSLTMKLYLCPINNFKYIQDKRTWSSLFVTIEYTTWLSDFSNDWYNVSYRRSGLFSFNKHK